MKNFSIAICDDDAAILAAIAGAIINIFLRYGVKASVDTFSSTEAFERKLKAKRYDVVFLDIDMPSVDGITFGKKLRVKKEAIDIIYLSSREDRVFESFAIRPFGFIRKSNFLQDSKEIIKLFISAHAEDGIDRTVDLKTCTSIVSLSVKEIVYIESLKDYQFLHLRDKTEPIKLKSTMNVIEKQLEPFGFLRGHQGYIVNILFIRQIDNADITLINDIKIQT